MNHLAGLGTMYELLNRLVPLYEVPVSLCESHGALLQNYYSCSTVWHVKT